MSVQIPDPTGRGLVVPKKEVVKELSEDSEEEVERGPKNLTSEEIDALPLREQRKYKTRIMLQDILDSKNDNK